MTTDTRTRRFSAPAYYLGRPAALWLAALAPRSTTHKSPRASCARKREIPELTPNHKRRASPHRAHHNSTAHSKRQAPRQHVAETSRRVAGKMDGN